MGRVAEQRRRAAARGTEVRSRRATVKRRIAAGELRLEQLLLNPDDVDSDVYEIAEQIPIGQLLKSHPGFGPATVTALVTDLQFNPFEPLGSIAPNHRRLLADEIERT